jgi:molybdate transport system substrate-binding protein
LRTSLALALLLTACVSPSRAETAQIEDVTVFAGSSLTDAFTRAGNDFTEANTRVRFTFNFGSSSTLATQITNGAPADVFASADEASMQKVADAGLAAGSPQMFAANELEIAVAPGNPKKVAGLADLARADIVLVLAAPTVPAGRYALEALAKAGISAKPVSQEIDVRAVLSKVSLGEADAGIVYVTDVKSAASRVIGVAIPPQHQVLARYPVAVVKDYKKAGVAQRFIGYLLSPGGQSVLAGFGFSKP